MGLTRNVSGAAFFPHCYTYRSTGTGARGKSTQTKKYVVKNEKEELGLEEERTKKYVLYVVKNEKEELELELLVFGSILLCAC